MGTLEAVRRNLGWGVRVLGDMISIPTVNPPGEGYREFANYSREVLRSIGFDVEVVEVPADYVRKYYPDYAAHPRYVVLGRYGGGRPVLHFNGHYDVVPAGSGWTRDPFRPVEEGGRIYGRGTTDMKGGIATFIAAVKSVLDEGVELKGTLEVALVPDEEAGGAGTRYLATERGSTPDYVVLGEPSTSGVIGIGHKGMVRALVRVFGRQVHGSVPWLGDNAFVRAARLVLRFLELYEPVLRGRKTSAPVVYEEGVYPTVNVGGYAESTSRKDNIVPGEFVFSIDRRVIPEERVDEVVEELATMIDTAARELGTRARLEVLSKVEPSMTPRDSPIVRALELCISEQLSTRPMIFLGLGRNDAVYYTNMLGSHAVSYGPGVMDVAHTPDEYTTVDEISRVLRVYRCLIGRVLGAGNAY